MATSESEPARPELYHRFVRPTPDWFADSGLGIFVHWGAYSVPAWAEPIGALGAIEDSEFWFAHNPYAEWYFNTIRIEGSPARAHHAEVHGGMPYDDFLDAWRAEQFDADEMVHLFARAGARYVVPTTKHHDGITLWDAPETHGRNTVARGPQRDLVAEFARATRAAGLRFGVYYSTGLDWHVRPMPAIQDDVHGFDPSPKDAEYARFVNGHLVDLIDRFQPAMLWADMGYPEAGWADGDVSLSHVLDHYYRSVPDGVINDRWGRTHWDFRCSEYEAGAEVESAGAGIWQRTRGIGFSFGYNQVEGEESYLSGHEAVSMLVDVVSRGGNLLLNVGPDAAGRVPALQRACLEGLAAWMEVGTDAVHAVAPFEAGVASDEPWTRWTSNADTVFAITEACGRHVLGVTAPEIDLASAVLGDGTPVKAMDADSGVVVELPDEPDPRGPRVIRFARRLRG